MRPPTRGNTGPHAARVLIFQAVGRGTVHCTLGTAHRRAPSGAGSRPIRPRAGTPLGPGQSGGFGRSPARWSAGGLKVGDHDQGSAVRRAAGVEPRPRPSPGRSPPLGSELQGRLGWGTAGAGPGILFGLGSPLALWTRPCTACGPPPSVRVGRLVLGWLGGARVCAPTNNCGGGSGGGGLEVGLVHTVGLASPLICNGATVARAGLRPRFGRGGPAMSA